jgi:hypothetical protein
MKNLPDKQTKQQRARPNQVVLSDRQADAWQAFIMSNDTKHLADYFEQGGKFESDARNAVLTILRDGHRKGTSKNEWKPYQAYALVEYLMDANNINKTEAFRQYAADTNQTIDAVRKQHKLGEELKKSREKS